MNKFNKIIKNDKYYLSKFDKVVNLISKKPEDHNKCKENKTQDLLNKIEIVSYWDLFFPESDLDSESYSHSYDSESDYDKWFPKFKDCECCEGYIYICEKEVCVNLRMCYCKMKYILDKND